MGKPKLPIIDGIEIQAPFHPGQFPDSIYDFNSTGVRNNKFNPMTECIIYALNLAYPVKKKRKLLCKAGNWKVYQPTPEEDLMLDKAIRGAKSGKAKYAKLDLDAHPAKAKRRKK